MQADRTYAEEHAHLISDLAQIGLAIEDVWDWVNGPTPVAAAPVLLSHLDRVRSEKLVEAIARSLSVG